MLAFAIVGIAFNAFMFWASDNRVEYGLSVLGLISSTVLLVSSLAA